MGGEELDITRAATRHPGLPPRGRGRELLYLESLTQTRITPAWAGKRRLQRSEYLGGKDYPRVGGEEAMLRPLAFMIPGLPPRGRGRGLLPGKSNGLRGITPAWAGKRIRFVKRSSCKRDYPRVGGEESIWWHFGVAYWGLPPRGRGRVINGASCVDFFRITPAWAGKRP